MDLFEIGYKKRIDMFKRNNQLELIAYIFAKYYEYFNEYGNISVSELFESSFEKSKYSAEIKQQMLKDSILLLKMKYDIDMISEDPLLLNKNNKDW